MPIAGFVGNASRSVIVSVDYRLAPVHPFPAPLDDAVTATRWVASHLAELNVPTTTPIILAGDSAGGHLVLVIPITHETKKGG